MLQALNKQRNNQRLVDEPSPLDQGLGFTIRFAYPDDEQELRRLAAFDSQLPLRGRTVVAEVAGEIWAAICIDGEPRVIADPFRRTAALVDLLRLHAVARVPAPRAHIPARGAGRRATAIPVSAR